MVLPCTLMFITTLAAVDWSLHRLHIFSSTNKLLRANRLCSEMSRSIKGYNIVHMSSLAYFSFHCKGKLQKIRFKVAIIVWTLVGIQIQIGRNNGQNIRKSYIHTITFRFCFRLALNVVSSWPQLITWSFVNTPAWVCRYILIITWSKQTREAYSPSTIHVQYAIIHTIQSKDEEQEEQYKA